jgi:hypothetical protein
MDYSLLVGVHLAEYEVEQASMEFCAEAPQSSPKGGDSSTKSLEESSSGTSGLSRQRSFVRRASTMSHKRNVETAGGSGGGDAEPSLSPSPSSTSRHDQRHQHQRQQLEDVQRWVHDHGRVQIDAETGGRCPHILLLTLSDALTGIGWRPQVHKIIGPDAYFMGIIDFQQRWNFAKRVSPSPSTIPLACPEGRQLTSLVSVAVAVAVVVAVDGAFFQDFLQRRRPRRTVGHRAHPIQGKVRRLAL